MKRVGKSQKEISKGFGHCKTVICNYLKSPNKYGQRKPTGRLEKISPQFKRRIVREVKKKTLSISKILKSLVNVPRTIRRHLNNEKIKLKKIIHRPRLTMKHKEKRLEYTSQYQTMSAKEWRKVVFSDDKKFNLNGSDDFQKYWHTRKFSRKGLLKKKHGGEGSLMI